MLACRKRALLDQPRARSPALQTDALLTRTLFTYVIYLGRQVLLWQWLSHAFASHAGGPNSGPVACKTTDVGLPGPVTQ